MQLFKFKYSLFLFLLLPTILKASFTDNECLNSYFDVEISHSRFPLGLLAQKLIMKKDLCKIDIKYTRYQFLDKIWEIDVCRGPIHIKKESFGTHILKRPELCNQLSEDTFCKNTYDILSILQDDGLIYAPGEKENLGSEHGQVYCTFLILKAYLERGYIFNRQEDVTGIIHFDKSGGLKQVFSSDSKAYNHSGLSKSGLVEFNGSSSKTMTPTPTSTPVPSAKETNIQTIRPDNNELKNESKDIQKTTSKKSFWEI